MDAAVVVVARKVRLDAGDPAGEPASVSWRDCLVLLAVPELDGHLDAGRVESPWGQVGDVVIPPALIAAAQGVLLD